MRRVLVGLAGLSCVLVFSGSAAASKPQPLGANVTGQFGGSGAPQVEQQSDYPFAATAVQKIAGCFWDINDFGATGSAGYLDAGRSYSLSLCLVSDPDPIYRTLNGLAAWWSSPHLYYATQVFSSSSALNVSVCYETQARCWSPAPVYNTAARLFEWDFCVHAVYHGDPLDPAVVEVPDSNGGRGVVSPVTTTVTSSGARAKTVSVSVGVMSDANTGPGCTRPLANPQSDYPFTWSSS